MGLNIFGGGSAISTPSRQDAMLTGFGVLSETYRQTTSNNSGAPGTQAIVAGLLGLKAGDTVTNIVVGVAGLAVGTTPTLIRLGLADKTGKILAITANVAASSVWTAALGPVAVALQSTYAVPTTDAYYAVFLENGTFGTTNLVLHTSTGQNDTGNALGAGPRLYGMQSGQTDLPAVNSSLTLVNTTVAKPWFAVS